MITENNVYFLFFTDPTTNGSADIRGHKCTDKRDSDATGTMGQTGHRSYGIAEAMGQGRRLRRWQRRDPLHVSTH